MIEIWQECASFLATNQKLAYQVRTIMKKGWFSDLEIIEIHQKMNKTVIQYQTHQVLINKKIQTEMNRKILKKKETLHNQTSHTKQYRTNTNTRTKNRFREFKENYEWKKNYLTITKKHRMENSQNGKNNSSIYVNKYICQKII